MLRKDFQGRDISCETFYDSIVWSWVSLVDSKAAVLGRRGYVVGTCRGHVVSSLFLGEQVFHILFCGEIIYKQVGKYLVVMHHQVIYIFFIKVLQRIGTTLGSPDSIHHDEVRLL